MSAGAGAPQGAYNSNVEVQRGSGYQHAQQQQQQYQPNVSATWYPASNMYYPDLSQHQQQNGAGAGGPVPYQMTNGGVNAPLQHGSYEQQQQEWTEHMLNGMLRSQSGNGSSAGMPSPVGASGLASSGPPPGIYDVRNVQSGRGSSSSGATDSAGPGYSVSADEAAYMSAYGNYLTYAQNATAAGGLAGMALPPQFYATPAAFAAFYAPFLAPGQQGFMYPPIGNGGAAGAGSVNMNVNVNGASGAAVTDATGKPRHDATFASGAPFGAHLLHGAPMGLQTNGSADNLGSQFAALQVGSAAASTVPVDHSLLQHRMPYALNPSFVTGVSSFYPAMGSTGNAMPMTGPMSSGNSSVSTDTHISPVTLAAANSTSPPASAATVVSTGNGNGQAVGSGPGAAVRVSTDINDQPAGPSSSQPVHQHQPPQEVDLEPRKPFSYADALANPARKPPPRVSDKPRPQQVAPPSTAGSAATSM